MATKSANESMCRSWSAAFGGRNQQFDVSFSIGIQYMRQWLTPKYLQSSWLGLLLTL